MIRFKDLLKEADEIAPNVRTVYHGTSLDKWYRMQKEGVLFTPFYVTDRYDIAKEFAVYAHGEDGFQKAQFALAKSEYNGDWPRFVDERRPDHPKGRLQIAYQFYKDITPVILELEVDLNDFEKVAEIATASGAYTYKLLPVDVVTDVHELSWAELLSNWNIDPNQLVFSKSDNEHAYSQ